MKISMFVHRLDDNPIVRAKPIAEGLRAMGHTVEILGLMPPGASVYAPYAGDFPYRIERCVFRIGPVVKAARQLARQATGDLIYACKPLVTTFWPALRASGYGREKPLMLDIEDDDIGCMRPDGVAGMLRLMLSGWRTPTDYKFNAWLTSRIRHCAGVTVSTRPLQARYGGALLLHGPIETPVGCPIGSDAQVALRRRWGWPPGKRVLLFSGIARDHKGFDLLLAVLRRPAFAANWHLALAGPPDQPLFRACLEAGGEACSVMGLMGRDDLPDLVQGADLIPVLQQPTPFSACQLPAKLLEAFAFGRPVIGTCTGDLPDLITGRALPPRGWILDPRTPDALMVLLDRIASCPAETLDGLGRAGARFHERYSSLPAIRGVLESFDVLKTGRSDS